MFVIGDLELRGVDEGVIWSKEGECEGQDDGKEHRGTQSCFHTSLRNLC